MHFNWDVSIGTVIAAVSLGLGLWRAHAANLRRFSRLESQVETLMEWFHSWVGSNWGPRRDH